MKPAHPVDIDDLTPAEYNPRQISAGAATGLRASMQRFGDISGITFNARTQRLVCGHQRVAQLRALGAQMVDGALQLPGGDRFPVRVVDMSEAEERAANVTANNPHIAGEFTDELDALLGELRQDIGADDFEELNLDTLLAEPVGKVGDVEHGEVADGEVADGEAETPDDSDRFSVYTVDQIADAAFSFFRSSGYPLPDLPLYRQMIEVNQVAAAARHSKLSVAGLRTCDTYQRHRHKCSAFGHFSPLRAFEDDGLLRNAIKRELLETGKLGDFPHKLTISSHTQGCYNFKPAVAARLYLRFARKGGIVLDPCAGWGGRMLGWHAAAIGGRYVACEPSTKSHAANMAMRDALGIDGAEVHCMPFEDFDIAPLAGACSFVFTSPPYFKKELYADEGTQSSVRYPTADQYMVGSWQWLGLRNSRPSSPLR